jgi:amino acid transporter
MARAGAVVAPPVEIRQVTRKLGLGAIVGIIFFSVSGGPYGLEDTVGLSGAGMAVLLIVVTPLIYSLPAALMVAELATMMPVSGGYYQWVKEGLGPFWGFQAGWWAWVASWFDLAIYPVLFVEFASYFIPALQDDTLLRWFVSMAFIWALAGMNMLGSSVVGDSAKLFLVIVLAPFFLIVLIGVFKLDLNPISPFTIDGASLPSAFGAGLFVIMWNYAGWDGLSTVAGDIDNPRRNYPRALAITIPMITMIYLIPTLVSLSVAGTTDIEWTAGAFTVIAEEVGGRWLGLFLSVAALVSAIGLFSAWMLSYSRIPFALANDGFLPRALTKVHPARGTPIRTIAIAALICSVAAVGPFEKLASMSVLMGGCVMVLELITLIVLRRRRPDLARPFKVPGGWFGPIIILLLPVFVITVAVWFTVLESGLFEGIGIALIGLGSGVVAYVVLLPFKRRSGIDQRVDFEAGALVDVGAGRRHRTNAAEGAAS